LFADLPPIPFDERHCHMAARLKNAGLPWKPHAGCFVWDIFSTIKPSSPFPYGVYFILNLHRFLAIFETIENMQQQLVWIPTWHQARLLCIQYRVDVSFVAEIIAEGKAEDAGEETLALLEALVKALEGL